MTETTQARLMIAANRGIPQSFKTYRTINVLRSGVDPNSSKVIYVGLPTGVAQNTTSGPPSMKSFDESDAYASYLKDTLLARGKHQKKKCYISGLKRKLLTARKEIRSLKSQLKQKDTIIANFKKDVNYFESILPDMQDTASLHRTHQDESDSPLTTTLPLTANPLKRSASEAFPECYENVKVQGLSKSSEECSSVLGDADETSWMPQLPCVTSTIDPDSTEILFNFCETDLDFLAEPVFEAPEPGTSVTSAVSGVCLHVQCF